jgi:ankyrin repeat protein
VVEVLLSARANPNPVGGYTSVPLMIASGAGHVEVVRLLLQAGASTDVVEYQKKTALYHAASRGHASVVSCLCSAGADTETAHRELEKYWETKKTPLEAACAKGHVEVVRALLAAKASLARKHASDYPNSDSSFYSRTPLGHCADNGQLQAARILLEALADVNMGSTHCPHQDTPLASAVERGHIAIAKLLCAAGADTDLQTPLHKACEIGNLPMVKLLCEAGADTSACDAMQDIPEWGAAEGRYDVHAERTPLEIAQIKALHARKKTETTKYGKIVIYLTKKMYSS